MQMQITAMGWQVYDAARLAGESVERSAFLLGALGLVQFFPLLLLSPVGGQAADRHNRLRIMRISIAVKGAVALMLTLASNQPPNILIPVMFVTAFATGAVNAFMPAAFTALLPNLVPRSELPQAVAWNSTILQTGTIVGPSVGGVLLLLGGPWPYAVALALFACAGALLLATQAPKQTPPTETRSLAMAIEGLKFIRDNKIVLGAMSLDLVVVLLAGAVALLPVFARDVLHVGPDEQGLLRSAMGVGAVSVALFLTVRPLRVRVGYWMFLATIVFGLATIVFGLSRSLWLTAAALAVAGGADMISVYVRQTLIQLVTPDDMRGRVGAASFVFISASNELGDFEAGLTARLFGPVMAVTLGGVLAITASLAWMRLFPQLTRADGFVPEHLEAAANAPPGAPAEGPAKQGSA